MTRDFRDGRVDVLLELALISRAVLCARPVT